MRSLGIDSRGRTRIEGEGEGEEDRGEVKKKNFDEMSQESRVDFDLDSCCLVSLTGDTVATVASHWSGEEANLTTRRVTIAVSRLFFSYFSSLPCSLPYLNLVHYPSSLLLSYILLAMVASFAFSLSFLFLVSPRTPLSVFLSA